MGRQAFEVLWFVYAVRHKGVVMNLHPRTLLHVHAYRAFLPAVLLGLLSPTLSRQVHAAGLDPDALLEEWQADYGGSQSDHLYRICPLLQGGYLAAGSSYSHEAGWDFWVLRLDYAGTLLWQKHLGGYANDQLFDMQPTPDGGFVLGGASSSAPGRTKTSPHYGEDDFWVVRLDAEGEVLWDRSYGGALFDAVYGLQATPEGGYIVGGISLSGPGGTKTSANQGSFDYWVVRLNAKGDPLWEQTFGGLGREFWARARQTADGGFLLFGSSASETSGNKSSPHYGLDDAWILRLNPAGEKLWEQTYGGMNREHVSEVVETPEGGLLVVGWSNSSPGGNKTSPSYGNGDAWILMLNADGSTRWEQSYGGKDVDSLSSVVVLENGAYLLGGQSQSLPSGTKTSPKRSPNDAWVVLLNPEGIKLWEQTFAGGSASDLKQVFESGFVLAGQSFHNATLLDGWVLKTGPLQFDYDTDGDGIPDRVDECPDTPPGQVVNAQGCSLDQLSPCGGSWANHGDYVGSVLDHAWAFYRAGLITVSERQSVIREAAQSDCGKAKSFTLQIQPGKGGDIRQGGLRFLLREGPSRGQYILESSPNLKDWTPVQTHPEPVLEMVLPPSTNDAADRLFYRVRVTP